MWFPLICSLLWSWSGFSEVHTSIFQILKPETARKGQSFKIFRDIAINNWWSVAFRMEGQNYGEGVKNDLHFTTSLHRWVEVPLKEKEWRKRRFGGDNGVGDAIVLPRIPPVAADGFFPDPPRNCPSSITPMLSLSSHLCLHESPFWPSDGGRKYAKVGSCFSQLSMWMQVKNDCCCIIATLRGGPERKWWKNISPMGRTSGGALDHPFLWEER